MSSTGYNQCYLCFGCYKKHNNRCSCDNGENLIHNQCYICFGCDKKHTCKTRCTCDTEAWKLQYSVLQPKTATSKQPKTATNSVKDK